MNISIRFFYQLRIELLSKMLCLLLCLAHAPNAAANVVEDWRISCGGTYNLCGFEDHNGNLVIEQSFEFVRPFAEGKAAVRLGGLWGYIDTKGSLLISAQYELANDFRYGLAEVVVDGRAGAIDATGQVVVDPQFRILVPLTENVIAARSFLEGYLPRSDALNYNWNLMDGDSSWGLFEIGKGWITNQDLHFKEFDKVNGGLVWARKSTGPKGYGLLSTEGVWVIEPTYQSVQNLNDDRAIIRTADNLWGAVDGSGALVIPPKFPWLGYFGIGFALTRSGTLDGLVRMNGELAGGQYFDAVEQPKSGLIPSVLLDGFWYGVDENDAFIDDPRDGQIYQRCSNGSTIRYKRGLFQLYSNEGQLLTDRLFEHMHVGNSYTIGGDQPVANCDDPIFVLLDGEPNFIKTDGQLLFDELPFDDVYSFENGHAVVITDGKMGLIDINGHYVFEPVYQNLHWRDDGLLHFKLEDGDEFSVMDLSGNEVVLPKATVQYEQTLNCGAGAKIFRKGDHFGMISSSGQIIVQAKYRALLCYENGASWAVQPDGEVWCPLNKEAQRISALDCADIKYPYMQSHAYPEEFDRDPFESSVLWVRAYYEFGLGDRPTPPAWVIQAQ